MKTVKILIADDHKIIRQGVREMLNHITGMEVVAEAETGNRVVELACECKPDVVIMDINMKGKTGIEATEEITRTCPGVRVLALSMHDDERSISRMLKSGAKGYILKTDGMEDLARAIETIMGGQNYFSKDASDAIMKKYIMQSAGEKKMNRLNIELTGREKDVLKLIAEGLQNREIGDRLSISPRTVDSHRRNLLQKIGAKNAAGLVRFAMENGLTE